MKLFDIIFGRAIDRRIAAYQSDLIERHIDEVQNMYRQMRGWRHDYGGHIRTMTALIDRPEELRAYLQNLSHDLADVDTIIRTGNVMVDAILNSKLSLIRSRDIAVNAQAIVPSDLQISGVDLCIFWTMPWRPVQQSPIPPIGLSVSISTSSSSSCISASPMRQSDGRRSLPGGICPPNEAIPTASD